MSAFNGRDEARLLLLLASAARTLIQRRGMCPKLLRPESSAAKPIGKSPLPLAWENILEAMADGQHRNARAVAERAGYKLTNHFRGILTAMTVAELLKHDDSGYSLGLPSRWRL
jgi:hypothetical protein